jgi:hypothetical protein
VSKQIATTAESTFEGQQFCADSEQVFSTRYKCVPVSNIGCLESLKVGAKRHWAATSKCALKQLKPPTPINRDFILHFVELLVGVESDSRSHAERARSPRALIKF